MSRIRRLLTGLGLAASLLVLPAAARAQTSASPYTTGYRFDTLRRIVGVISPDPDGAGPIGFPAVRYTYDADGDLIRTETGFLSAWQSEAVAPSSWAGFTIKTTKTLNLDAMGNPTQTLTSGASGQSLALTQTAYDADDRAVCSVVRMNLATTATDACALGAEGAYGPDRVTSTHYDGDGHVDYVKRAVGISGLEQFYARYTYTNNGQKQTETDANGNTTQYAYDGYDRLASVYYPSKTTGSGAIDGADYEAYGYDAGGNRTYYRRRNGQTYGYGYDALNRQTLKTRSDNANLNVSSGYDLLGHLIRAQFADGSMSLVNSYDAVGRQLTATETIGSASRTLSYHYDQGSLRDVMTFPDNVQQQYQYNGGNQLTWTGLPDASVGYAPTYDGYDRINGIARANSANTSLGYDDADRVTSLAHSFANSGRNVGWTFNYNPASQLMTAATTNTDYDYVETSSQPDNRTFNGLNQDATIAAVNGGTGYDGDGNMQNDGSRQFSYDIDNHVTGMTGPATSGYLYDPIGRLAQETVNGVVTQFLYDGTNLVAEYDGSGALQRRYMHALGADQPWVQFTGSSAGASTAKYLYANYQGSVIALADGSGTVADADIYKYGPYGEPLDLNNNPSTSGFRFRYTGQTLLEGTGLYYYKARVYDPIAGRFLQTDPIGSNDDLDLYAYTGDDPVNGIDSSGLSTCTTIDAGGGQSCDFSEHSEITIIGWRPPQLNNNGESSGNFEHCRMCSAKSHRESSESSDVDESGNSIHRYHQVEYGNCNGNACNPRSRDSTITYKRGAPAAGGILRPSLQCVAQCSGGSLFVTSTTDSHNASDPHSRGLAADVRSTDPTQTMQCAADCGFQYQQNEYAHPSPHATGGHVHIQLPPGRNGAVGPYKKSDGDSDDE